MKQDITVSRLEDLHINYNICILYHRLNLYDDMWQQLLAQYKSLAFGVDLPARFLLAVQPHSIWIVLSSGGSADGKLDALRLSEPGQSSPTTSQGDLSSRV